jgi:O-antigen ligase
MAILIVVMVGKVSEWVPGLSSIPLAKLAFLLAVISAWRNRESLPVVRVRSLRTVRPGLAFMALAILSISFSIYKSNSLFESETIVILLLSMVLLLKVTHTFRDFERILMGFVGAGASLSLGVVLHYHGGRGEINGNFDPNDIAYALDTVLPIVVALRARSSRLGSLIMSALTVIIVLAVVLTGSRGGAIGLGVILAATIAFPLSRDRSGALRRFSLGRTLVRCTVLIVTFALAWGYLPAETRERMATLVDLKSDYSADPNLKGSRTAIWRRDIGLALERPIGYGLGSAEAVDGLGGGQYRAAHNSLVEAFVELGVLGVLLYLYSYIISWRSLARIIAASRLARSGEQEKKAALYARALRVALAANLAAGFFLSQAYSPAIWTLIATAAALLRITELAPGAKASTVQEPALRSH